MPKQVLFKGNILTLVGRSLKVGMAAPYFRATDQELKDVTLADFKGVKIITSFLSLDTPVCDLQVKEFNKRVTSLSGDVMIIGISMDLPFAQKRFCESFGIKNVKLVSDYKYSSFGINYGLLVKELNLLARAVLILDKNDYLRYIQVVDEMTHSPDYEDTLRNLEQVLKTPALSLRKSDISVRCKPCETGVPSLTKEKREAFLVSYPGWQLAEDKKIVKEFKFKDFIEAKYFLDLVSVIAEDQGHHPTMTIIYDKLKITLTTHAASGLTENDFIMAKLIDELMG